MKGKLLVLAVVGISTAVSAQPQQEQERPAEKAHMTVKRVDLGDTPPIERVDSLFEAGGIELHEIGCFWPEHPKKPDVHFRIAHSGSEIYIKYYVHEDQIRAVSDRDNRQPWNDTCVEFFVMPGVDETFYNLEMNCIGYGILHGRMPGREHGTPVGNLEKIRRLTSMPREAFDVREGDFEWTITLAVPIEMFYMSEVPPLSGRTIRANFHKCGYYLPQPHYLTWSPVLTPEPSFHEPDFFGDLYFE